ncbi:unnamed protein product [Parnassius apollo]|uniref:(apollo) hypothetical protein n=1 Tax=Parnassius apollo TaxID=110799 RepID=A0A8S3X8A5_PARAO|nr:unnamed protein product [Parnassius apollo]
MTLLKRDVACLKAKQPGMSNEVQLSEDIDLIRKEIDDVKKIMLEFREVRHDSSKRQDDLILGSYHNDKNTRNKLNNSYKITNNSNEGIVEIHIDTPLTDVNKPSEGESTCKSSHSFAHTPLPVTLLQKQNNPISDTDTHYVPTYRDIANTIRTQLSKRKNDEGFTIVSKRRHVYRYRNERGTLQNANKLQAAESFAYFYLSRTKKHINENDIRDYIKEMKDECIDIEMLKQTRETHFNSFKITVLASKINNLLQKSFWPEGLVFRRYRNQRSIKGNTLVCNK